MLLLQDLAFRPAPTSFAPPVPKSLVSMPADRNQAPMQRPESQEDWESKKETIRNLYLDKNLPLKDLISTMSSKHSFSATERMYKRLLVNHRRGISRITL
ncbi:n1-acetylpolyamine oxidase [Colletotrichum graminicola]|nr:n1-acetylpolyamine oxidase [Colletotrichum graminicola]